jgi:hypothetical protein
MGSHGKAARRIGLVRTAKGQCEARDKGAAPALGSTDPRRRQATNLFSRADQTSVIKIHGTTGKAILSNMTRKEAAAELNVSARWLSDFVRKEGVPVLRAGHRLLFDAGAIPRRRQAAQEP